MNGGEFGSKGTIELECKSLLESKQYKNGHASLFFLSSSIFC